MILIGRVSVPLTSVIPSTSYILTKSPVSNSCFLSLRIVITPGFDLLICLIRYVLLSSPSLSYILNPLPKSTNENKKSPRIPQWINPIGFFYSLQKALNDNI